MTRKSVQDLLPNTQYAIRVRAVNKTAASQWSRRFVFTTIGDTVTIPAPQNVTWAPIGDTFHAEWDKVTTNANGDTIAIARYEVEVVGGSTTKYLSVSPTTTASKVTFDLTYAQNKALFGSIQTSVTFRVRAVDNKDLKGTWSSLLTASINQPDPPTAAVVTEIIDGIKFTWTPPANMLNVDGYHVYVGPTAGFTPSSANLVYDGVNPGFTYSSSTYSLQYFKIRSYSKFGLESTDLTAQGTPKSPFLVDTIPPDVPTSLSPTLQRTGNEASAKLTWVFDANATQNKDIQNFAIKWRKVGDTYFSVEIIDKTLRDTVIRLPQAYSDYEFQIASIDFVANYSAYSSLVSLTGSVPGPPPAVTGLTASTGLDSVQLSWSASTAGDVVNGGYYNVDIATNAGFTTGLKSYTTGSTSITISGLSPTTTYYYRVSATDSTAQTGTATSGSAATTSFPTVSPSDGSAPASSPTPSVSGGLGFLFITWSPVTNNDPVTYEVHVSTASGFTPGSGTKVAEISGTVATLEKDASGAALLYGTTYYVKIIAKDRDGAAAASTQGSGQIAKVASGDVNLTAGDVGAAKVTVSTSGPGTAANNSNDVWFVKDGSDNIIEQWTGNGGTSWTKRGISDSAIANLSAGKLLAGSTFTNTLNVGATLTVQSGGQIKSTLYDTSSGASGYSLTDTALIIRSGTINAATLESGTSIVNNLNVTGYLTVSSSGGIKSSNYVANTTGYSLTSAGLDIRSGTVSFGTMVGGTVTTTGLVIGAGGQLMIDSSGAIVSNNWASLTTGWKISATGIELNDANSKIKATAVIGDTVAGRDITVTSGGSIHSSDWNGSTVGWQLSYNGLRLNNGTIYGTTVQTNALTSITNDSVTGQPLFSINAGGYAQFAGARILGNTVLGSASSTAHYIQSFNYSAGSVGWKIDAAGNVEFNGTSAKFRGDISGATGTFSGALSGATGTFSGSLSGATGTFSGTVSGGTIAGGTITTDASFTAPYVEIKSANKSQVRLWSGASGEFTPGIIDTNIPGPGDAVLRITSPNIGSNVARITLNGSGDLSLTSGAPWPVSIIGGLSASGGGITLTSTTEMTMNIPSGQLILSASSNMASKLRNDGADVALIWKGSTLIVGQASWNAATVTGGVERDLVAGVLYANTTTVQSASDRNFKKNIRPVVNASDMLSKVDIRSFYMKKGRASGPLENVKRYGVIAQELQEVFPDAVWHSEIIDGLTVSYEPLYNLNIAATNEHTKKIEELEEKINKLEEIVKRLS